MNIDKIREIVNQSTLPNYYLERLIYQELSMDENVINHILEILNAERKNKNELIKDMNLELSRADIMLVDEKLNKSKREFVVEEIVKFYKKYKHIVRHCFKDSDK